MDTKEYVDAQVEYMEATHELKNNEAILMHGELIIGNDEPKTVEEWKAETARIKAMNAEVERKLDVIKMRVLTRTLSMLI